MIYDSNNLSIFLSDLENPIYRLSYAKSLATQCLSQSTSVAYDKLRSYQSRLTININDCETIYDVSDILKTLSSRSGSNSSDDILSLFFESEEDNSFQQDPPIEECDVTLLSREERMDCMDRLLEDLNNDLRLPICPVINNNNDVSITPLSRDVSPVCNLKSVVETREVAFPESSIQSRLLSSVVNDTSVSKRKRQTVKEGKEKKVKKPVGRPAKVVLET